MHSQQSQEQSRQDRELLRRVKQRLKVTYDESDEEIGYYIQDGKAFINARTDGVRFDLSSDDTVEVLAISMLMNYIRYAWNGTTMFFGTDYLSDILTLQLEVAMRDG